MISNRRPKTNTPQTDAVSAYIDQIRSQLNSAWLPAIYSERIRKMRTRAYTLAPLKPDAKVQIQHTLLGIELKIGKRRLLCPDLATARYLSVFARAGCERVAIPYDISKLSQLADELESTWHRMFLIADQLAAGNSEAFRRRLRRALLTQLKDQVEAAGAGNAMPDFKQSTKQRK